MPDVRQIQKQTLFAVGRYRSGHVTTVLFASQVLLSTRHENLPLEFFYVTMSPLGVALNVRFEKRAGGTG
jgi:hypothetical protein